MGSSGSLSVFGFQTESISCIKSERHRCRLSQETHPGPVMIALGGKALCYSASITFWVGFDFFLWGVCNFLKRYNLED